MGIITADFETYFDKDYTLKKLTTEGYIRDARFEPLVLGLLDEKGNTAACVDPDPAGYFIPPHIQNKLRASAMVCHHAHFDGLIFSHHYEIKPAFWFDTLSMARCAFPHDRSHSLEALAAKFGLPAKTVPYEEFKGKRADALKQNPELYKRLIYGCMDDVELTYKIFKKLLPLVPREELKLIDMTVRMFTEPVLKLDRDRAKAYMDGLAQTQEALLNKLGVDKKDLSSNDKFAKLLESMGIDPPVKKSPKTGREAYAFAKTDPGFKELENSDNEIVRLLAEARLSAKSTIGETRAGRLLDANTRGDLPVYLKYYGAHTGRWSGGDQLNFQNFPRGGELRKSLMAPEGYVLCVVDLSQIECRVLNWLAGEDWVLKAFLEGRDLYCEMASAFYGRLITKADKLERFLGKTLVLGAGYGVGWKKLQGLLRLNGLFLTDHQAQTAIQTYRQRHPNVVQLWNTAGWCLDYMNKNFVNPMGKGWSYDIGPLHLEGKKVYMPNGAVLDYSGLATAEDGKGLVLVTGRGTTRIYGGKFVENLVQALSRVVMGEAMLKINKIYQIVTTTHDEIVYLVPEDEAEIGMELGLEILKAAPAWATGLPLNAEGGFDVRYSK